MLWLTLGALLLYVGLSDLFWRKLGISYESAETWTDARLKVAITRISAALIGAALVAMNFPFPFTAVAYAGWFVMGVILFAICQTPIFWNQFKNVMEKDSDWAEGFCITRIVGTVLAILMIGVGIGNGVPGWHDIPDPYAEQRVEVKK